MPRGQRNKKFVNFLHWLFESQNKAAYQKKNSGSTTIWVSKLQVKLTQRLPALYLFEKFSQRARSMYDVAWHCDINYVRNKDARKQLAETSLNWDRLNRSNPQLSLRVIYPWQFEKLSIKPIVQ